VKSDAGAALPMDRRDFLKGDMLAAGAAGRVLATSVRETAQAAPETKPGLPWDANGRMGIGINLEYVRHADKSLAYGVKRAGQLGYQWVEPSMLDGRCILRNHFSVAKMTMESPSDTILYRSKLNPKINRNFEVFTPTDFLAAITQHIPDKGAQMVRYCGWHSNKMRGQRHRTQNGGAARHHPRNWHPKSGATSSCKCGTPSR